VIIRAGGASAVLVEGLEGACQQHHGDVLGVRIALERLAHLVATLPGHHHIREHHVRAQLAATGNRVQPVVHRGHLKVLGREDHPNDLADGERVVGDQQILRHRRRASGASTPRIR
jgi:hypothetical protein